MHPGEVTAMPRFRVDLPAARACNVWKFAGIMLIGLLGSATMPTPAAAQRGVAVADVKLTLKEPVAHRVYQRGTNNRADIPIVLDESAKGAKVTEAYVRNSGVEAPPGLRGAQAGDLQGIQFVDGKLVGVPAGGPYTIHVEAEVGGHPTKTTIGQIYVGDLWILAGQSNMEGVGDLIDVTPPDPNVMLLGMDGTWKMAEEPLHWLIDSPDPVHSGDPKTREERSAKQHKTRTKGAGLGLPFGVTLHQMTNVPIGLVACAHGGTSMEQWNPAKKGDGGNSLYGSMLRQLKLAGGKFKGLLWYQGESDALTKGEVWKVYSKVFDDFIAAVRADIGQADLPFYVVQIGRFINSMDSKGWNAVQEAQRTLPDRIANTAVISVIDLELDDGIHIGVQGQKRAGQRLAKIAARELFGQVGATTPTFDRVQKGPGNTLIVKFKGVNFTAEMGGMRGGMGGSMGGGMRSMPLNQMGGMMGGMGGGGMGGMMGRGRFGMSPGEGPGLRPATHIGGFSICKEDGTTIPMIFEAKVGKAKDTVVLQLTGAVPAKSFLWYGHGLDPYANLVDAHDMAVPVFGPIALDGLAELPIKPTITSITTAPKPTAEKPQASDAKPAAVKLLIITGDQGHDWPRTTEVLKEFLSKDGRIDVAVTKTPAKDLTDENLAKHDVLLLNYKDTGKGAPETVWSDANKKAFLDAVKGGKGLVVYHFASSAFTKPTNWTEFEEAIGGGWRTQGFHGPRHVFTVKTAKADHPIAKGLPPQFEHAIDELYQNSLMVPGNEVLATAYSDPKKPKGTGKDEPVIWVNTYGKGRVYVNALGHDPEAMADPQFREWMRRGVLWAATGKVD
jgi:sialate O-acetylesterase